jgi:hypothetical protein
MGHRFIESAKGQTHGGQIAEEDGMWAVYGQGTADEVKGFLMATGLVVQHAEQVQGVRVIRRFLEHGAVQGLGFL